MAQVERLLNILLDAPVQRDNAAVGRVVGAVGRELEAGAAEAVLLLKDGVVVDGDLDGLVVRDVELGGAGSGGGRLLEDLGPAEVVALDVVRVEDAVGRVELRERGVGGDAAVEEDRALGGGGGGGLVVVGDAVAGMGGRCEGGARQRGEDEKERRHFCCSVDGS